MRSAAGILSGVFFCLVALSGAVQAADNVPNEKWYVGGGLGLGGISGPDWTAQDNYYATQGYWPSGGSGWLGMGGGLDLYGGYRLYESLDLELGLASISTDHSTTYKNAAGSTAWSRRTVSFTGISASALLRPPYGYGHFLFLKLGVHNSDYGTDKTSDTGTAPNASAIAANDTIPTDRHATGWGSLVGVGMDFGRSPGIIRLQYVLYNRIGGTRENAGLLSVSYHYNF